MIPSLTYGFDVVVGNTVMRGTARRTIFRSPIEEDSAKETSGLFRVLIRNRKASIAIAMQGIPIVQVILDY